MKTGLDDTKYPIHLAVLNAIEEPQKRPRRRALRAALDGATVEEVNRPAPFKLEQFGVSISFRSRQMVRQRSRRGHNYGDVQPEPDASSITPLYLAVSKLKYECAMKLLDAGANVHHADDARRTPLHAAMQHGEGGDALLALLNRLLQLGAAVGAVDREQRTPLHWASGKDALPLVTALITAKADVNAMDWAQHAPLHWACPMDAHECAGALPSTPAVVY